MTIKNKFNLIKTCFHSEEQEQDEKPPGSQEKANGSDDKVLRIEICYGFT